jgi:hypothetical protein
MRFILMLIINALELEYMVAMLSVVLLLYYLLSLRLHPYIYYQTQAMDLL